MLTSLISRISAVAVCVMIPQCPVFAQSGSCSARCSFNIVKEVKPPILSVSRSGIEFRDVSSNNALDAGETDELRFEVENNGYGPAYGCVARVKLSGSSRDVSVQDVRIPEIGVGKKLTVSIPVKAGMNTQDGRLTMSLQVDEPNGFGVSPIPVEVSTKAFVAPMLKVTDYAVTGTSGTLQKLSRFGLRILLQNTDHGNAQDVTVNVTFPDNVFVLDGEQAKKYPVIESGNTRSLDYVLIANNNYSRSSIPVKVSVREKYGKYSEDRVIDLALNQPVSSGGVSIAEKASAPSEGIRIATFGSDVDKVPVSGKVNENTFAVIIANENYQNDARVDYALKDGSVFREYCRKTVGIPDGRIKFTTDATLNNIRSAITWAKQVADAYDGDARMIFYYAGHGLPDVATRSAYLLPVDGDGRNPRATGMSVDKLYAELATCRTKSTLVLLDACFSGAKRDGGMVTAARGVVIAPEKTDPYGNLVVMSASSGEETAFKYDAEGHGMFTYFLLKALKEYGGEVNLETLSEYVIKNVRRSSITVNGKSQTPTVLTGSAMAEGWRQLMF